MNIICLVKTIFVSEIVKTIYQIYETIIMNHNVLIAIIYGNKLFSNL